MPPKKTTREEEPTPKSATKKRKSDESALVEAIAALTAKVDELQARAERQIEELANVTSARLDQLAEKQLTREQVRSIALSVAHVPQADAQGQPAGDISSVDTFMRSDSSKDWFDRIARDVGVWSPPGTFFFFFFFFNPFSEAKVKKEQFVRVLEQKILKEPSIFPKPVRDEFGLNVQNPDATAASSLARKLFDEYPRYHEKKTLPSLAGAYRKSLQIKAFGRAMSDDVRISRSYAERLANEPGDAEVIREEMRKKRRHEDPTRLSEAVWDDFFRQLEGTFFRSCFPLLFSHFITTGVGDDDPDKDFAENRRGVLKEKWLGSDVLKSRLAEARMLFCSLLFI